VRVADASPAPPAPPSPFLIKICGVTNPDDVEMAAEAGADAIGVNFWPGSKRFVGGRYAAERVLSAIPGGILRVGVFVNSDAAVVERARIELGLDRVQLHGTETPAAFADLPRASLLRAVRVRDEASFAEDAAWRAGLFLYDAFVDGFGGGGVAAPWPLVARRAARPFLLAGGLTPDNVAEAIAIARPDGVDVASGVERAPGVKDRAKVVAFVAAARAAAARL
jgi:phosphoribosylanthranilate isomerase